MLKGPERFPYSAINLRPKYAWPGGKRLAVYVSVNVEHFPFGVQVGPDLDRATQPWSQRSWLWREYGAAALSRLVVGERHVEITVANRLRCRFSRSVIASAAAASWRSVPEPPPPEYINTAKPLEPNVMLVLDESVEANLPLGMRRRYARIGIRVGDPVAVLAVLNSPIASPRTRS